MPVFKHLLLVVGTLLVFAQSVLAEPLRVAVSIPPHANLVERLGGVSVSVTTVLRPGANPHTYEPTPGTVQQLRYATLYFRTGMEFEEGLLPKLIKINPHLKIVDLRHGLDLLEVSCPHGHDHHHDHGTDPHIWLSPLLLEKQVETISDTLVDHLPDNQETIRTQQAVLAEAIAKIHAELTERLASARGQKIYVYHPAFAYFCRDFDLIQVPVELGGKEVTPRHLQALIEQAKADNVRVIFAQPQYSPRTVQVLAEALNADVLLIDDLAEDPVANLRKLADQFMAK